MNTLSNVVVSLEAQTAKYQDGFAAAGAKTRKFRTDTKADLDAAKESVTQFSEMGIKALEAFGVSLSIGAVVEFGKAVLDLGKSIQNLSAQANIDTTSFQVLSGFFRETGVNSEQLALAFNKLQKNTEGAVQGSKQLADAFAGLGIDPVKFQALSLVKQMEVLGAAVDTATDQNKAFYDVCELLSTKGTPKLLAALKQLGIEGYDAVKEKSKDVIATPEEIKRLADLANAWERLKTNVLLTAAALTQKNGLFQMLVLPQVVKYVQTHPTTPANRAMMDENSMKNVPNASPAQELANVAPDIATDRSPLSWNTLIGDPAKNDAAYNYYLDHLATLEEKVTLVKLSVTQDFAAMATDGVPSDKMIAQTSAQTEAYKRMADPALAYKEQIDAINLSLSKHNITAEVAAKDIALVTKQMNESVKQQALSIQEIFDPTARYKAEIDTVNDALAHQTISATTAAQAIKVLNEQMSYAQVAFNQQQWEATHQTLMAIGGAINTWADGMAHVIINGGSMRDVFKQLIISVEEMIVKMLILDTLFALIGMVNVGAANNFATMVGLTSNAFGGPAPTPGHKATGGPVTADTAFMVGERGPELFVPDNNGTIIPNDKLNSGGSGGGTIIQNVTVQAGVSQTVRAEIYSLLPMIKQQTLAAIIDAKRRGGTLGASV